MGQIIGELRQLADALIEAVEHHVDAAGQLCQFQRQAVSGQAMLQVLGRHPPGNAPEVPQWLQAALHQPPGAGADQQQQQRQREQGGVQVGLQQGVVVGAVERHHHLDRGVVAQAHQPGHGEYLVAIAVAPRMKGQAGIGAQIAYLRFQRWPQAEQVRVAAFEGQHAEAEVVVPHHQVEQGMGAAAQVFATQVDAQVVLDLQHLARQVLACAAVQFVIEGEHRQAGQQQHQCGAHQRHAQAQAQ
ncbi:hypothetical protein D3C79_689140 [compost metagenome]